MTTNEYQEQDRGDDDAYERYLRGMNQSMRQKVALTAAHLLGQGKVADMGMGSGAGTLALAALYPQMDVVGIDINPEMVERARVAHRLPNLTFEVGDIAEQVFEPETFEAIFNSSVLHHVTTFNGYNYAEARRALENQAVQLAVGGSLIVRDFVAPEDREVVLSLPANDGEPGDDPVTCSTACLFERFAKEFRSLSDEPGFEYQALDENQDGWQRFRVAARRAVEFVLRKDYRADWKREVQEEYTYWTQKEFESAFATLGLRLLASFPIHNPWIVRNRLRGRCAFATLDGQALELPPTNYLIVGEKVPDNEGVRFVAGEEVEPGGFLQRHCFQHVETGETRDLVRRPGTTVDVLPFFTQGNAVFVLARKGHPRPVLQSAAAHEAIDDGAPVGYVTEPIVAHQTDLPLGLTVEQALQDAAAIDGGGIRAMAEAGRYYPSPGGLMEEVRAVHVEIEPRFVEDRVTNRSGFSTGGSMRAIDARQLLRAAQVGALPDARLEVNVYELLLSRQWDVGPWIGAQIALAEDVGPSPDPERFADCKLTSRRSFREVPLAESNGFLRHVARIFREQNGAGDVLAEQERELVIPSGLSCNTVCCAVLRQHKGQALIGLDEDDLPAAQCFGGSSALWVAPAWRLPKSCSTRSEASAWIDARLTEEHGLTVLERWELGGRYHPSAAVTPEMVYPFAVRVREAESPGSRQLRWVPLADVVAGLHRVQDGHLRIVALRAAHALGVMTGS